VNRCLLLFEESIKSEFTRQQYRSQLDQFLKFTKLKNHEAVLNLSQKELQELLEDYLFFLKKTMKNPNNIQFKFPGVKHFLEMNDVLVNWKKIYKMFPEKIKTFQYRAWTTEEIQKMLESTTFLRNKALVHFIASTGARVGVFDYPLQLKHLKSMSDNCKAVLLYAGTNEEYWAFLTPEAAKHLDDYLAQRLQDKENLGDESPIFREIYETGRAKPKSLTRDGARSIIYRMIRKSIVDRKKIGDRTYDVQMDHGFRKRFNTILKLKNEINSNIAEKILGHKNGLDGVYFTPSLNDRFNEFKKAIRELTIDSTERLRLKNSSLEHELAKHEIHGREIEKLKKQYEFDHILVAQFSKILRHFGIEFDKIDGTPYDISNSEIDSYIQTNFPEVLEHQIKDNPELTLIGE